MKKNDRQHTNRLYKPFRSLTVFGLVLGMCTYFSTANATTALVDWHSDGSNAVKAVHSSLGLISDNLKLGFYDQDVLYLKFGAPDNNVSFDFDMYNVSIGDPGITKIGLRVENVVTSTAPTQGSGTFASYIEQRITFEGYPSTEPRSASEISSVIGDDYIELWYTTESDNSDGHLTGGFIMNLDFDWAGFELADPTKSGFNLNIGINDPSLDLSTSHVPVPAAAWLFGTALTGLFLKRRKI